MPEYQNLFTSVQAVGPAQLGVHLGEGNSPRTGAIGRVHQQQIDRLRDGAKRQDRAGAHVAFALRTQVGDICAQRPQGRCILLDEHRLCRSA